MKQEPKVVTRKVKVLTNPNPTFVSLVKNGAIQEPFKVLKTAEKGPEMPIQKRETTTKSGDGAVRKIVFDNSVYETEASVKKYLDDNGYSDYEITKDGATFVAEGKDVKDSDFVAKSIKSVPMTADKTVLGYVGTLAEKTETTTEKTEKTEKDAKGEKTQKQERVVKLSYWDMYSSDDQTVQGVIKDGMKDGVPPGCTEIIQATAYAMANVLKAAPSDRKKMIASIGAEFGDLINATADLYDGVIAEKAVKSDNTKKFAEGYRAEVAGIIEAVEKGVKPESTEKTEKSETPEKPAPTTKTETTEKTETVQAPALDLAAITDAITKTIAPLSTQVGDLAKKLDAVQGIAEDARNRATKSAETVEAMASQAPTKKSATEQGEHASSRKEAEVAAEKTRKEEGLRNFGNAMGLRLTA